MMSRKIAAIAAGEAHTLALTADGGVFSWGRGTFGRLGTGKDQDELVPVRVAADVGERRPATAKFVAVAAGAYHSLALEDDGSVWSWGYNTYGQLGHGEEDNSSLPCLVQCFQELGSSDSLVEGSNTEHATEPLTFSSVKAGGMTSLAIDSLGALWMWGNCPQATASGEVSMESSTMPLPIRAFNGHIVAKVACGNEHIVAAVTAGEMYTGGALVCYAWGTNNHGQLGLGDNESRSHPQVIPTFDQESPWAVYEIACGAYHTALLTHEKSNQESESKCWTFGLGENGQLGHGTSRSKCTAESVNGLPEDAVLISVDCGLFHTSVVSAAGEVWSWGMEKGLGLCPDACFTGNDAGDALSPLRIQSAEANGFRFPGPVQVACGAAHTVLVGDDGSKLWAWGRGRNGVLGTGQTSDSFVPRAVVWTPDASLKEGAGTSGEDIGKDGLSEETAALKEISLLQRKLTLMERYAAVLHVAIFRKPLDERSLPRSLQDSGVFDIRKELEGMVESAKTEDLAQMELFYRGMLSNVKDKMMKRRIQEIVKESLDSISTGRQYQY